jgi:hypothetical protein
MATPMKAASIAQQKARPLVLLAQEGRPAAWQRGAVPFEKRPEHAENQSAHDAEVAAR